MSSRRNFLKMLLGLSALSLPWTLWPGKINQTFQSWVKRPSVKLITPMSELPQGVTDEEMLYHSAMEDITALSAPEMQGRQAGTVGENKASSYLSKQMSSLGLIPMGDQGKNFTQVFTIPPVSKNVVNGRLTFIPGTLGSLRTPSVNLLGAIKGKVQDQVILVSAHYDHLGVYQGKIYPGANDNASGVSCVLEVIRRLLRDGKPARKTVVFAFWSAEEMGFIGSKAFVQSPTFPLGQIQAMLNIDTVGNGPVGDFGLWSVNEDNIAYQAVRAAAIQAGASAGRTPFGGHNSDQASFAQTGIPAVTLMAGDWLNKNHTPEDTIDLIEPEQLELASDIVYRAVQLLAFK
ncbi:M28 family metallopeptidase [Desulfitobacterium sp.]|uniref:M28 family metallopeptidase n=1 Tax=Desulfitobacterium sp. TaxID=49981 RepID=UPI002B1FA655|nr:M20/M25/M40 family metallo-hydrolase [Desulfitobacterium sp.]MEA4902181.1 M20/M25/M40 family metallo-hydrolase [Desulfitobacterium sp.]